MGNMSREKGKRGERELAAALREFGFPARRGQQYSGTENTADVVGLEGLHLEVKRTEALSLYTALEQAVRDSGESGDKPVVVHRRNGKPWVVVMGLSDWVALYRAYLRESER